MVGGAVVTGVVGGAFGSSVTNGGSVKSAKAKAIKGYMQEKQAACTVIWLIHNCQPKDPWMCTTCNL